MKSVPISSTTGWMNPLHSTYTLFGSVLEQLPWWLAVLAFVAFVLLLFSIEGISFRLVRRWLKKHQRPWADLILEAFHRTIFLFILSGAIGLVPVLVMLPEAGKKWVSGTAQFLVFLALALFIQKFLIALYRRVLDRNESLRTYSTLVYFLVYGIISSLFLMIFLDTIGVSITPLIASLGVGSVAVAFALQETLSSLFSGLYLITSKPIRVGDFVKLEGGEEGRVEKMGWRSSRIRLLNNNVIVIPNGKLSGFVVTNYSLSLQGYNFGVPVTVDYRSDLKKVEKVTLEVARDVMETVKGGVPQFNPGVGYSAFGEQGVEFSVGLRAKQFTDSFGVKHEFIKRLHQRYQEEGIVIPFQMYKVLVRNEN